jgi:hypothetical protein
VILICFAIDSPDSLENVQEKVMELGTKEQKELRNKEQGTRNKEQVKAAVLTKTTFIYITTYSGSPRSSISVVASPSCWLPARRT